MTVTIECFEDAQSVIAATNPYLATRPVEHNLLATLLGQRLAKPEPAQFWLARNSDGHVCGFALQSPPLRPVILSIMPAEAIDAMAAAISAQGIDVPGAQGEAATVARFAGRWTELRDIGAKPSKGLRLYEQLSATPVTSTAGELRRPHETERDLVVQWTSDFLAEIDEPIDDAGQVIDSRMAAGSIFVWDEHGPRSLAAHSKPVHGVARLQTIFTPRHDRGQGYATKAAAALSEQLQRQALHPILYTDLINPISNKLYRKIGYRAVCEVLIYDFE
jgi:predicted GNAT family acetyltransferase